MIVARSFLVEDDQIRLKPAHAPVGVGHQDVANQGQAARIGGRYAKNGKVSRDAVSPQRSLPEPVAQKAVGGDAKGRIWINQRSSQFLKSMRACGADPQVAEFELTARPRHLEGSCDGLWTPVLGAKGK